MMSPVATFLLENCFWHEVDAGISPEDTPLLQGVFNHQPLQEVLSLRFGLSPAQAESEIEAAVVEVSL